MTEEIERPAGEAPEEGSPPEGGQDTEGHFLPNIVVSRQVAVQRERDIRRNLERHELEIQARQLHEEEPRRRQPGVSGQVPGQVPERGGLKVRRLPGT